MREDIFESDSDSSFGMTEEDSLLLNKSSNVPIDLGPPLAPAPETQTVSNGGGGGSILLTGGGSKDEDSDLFGSSFEGGAEATPVLSGLPTLPREKLEESALVRKVSWPIV